MVLDLTMNIQISNDEFQFFSSNHHGLVIGQLFHVKLNDIIKIEIKN